MKRLYNALIYLSQKIHNDTWDFLESDFDSTILPNITIKYKNVSIDIPMDLAETNNFISDAIDELRELIKEEYL